MYPLRRSTASWNLTEIPGHVRPYTSLNGTSNSQQRLIIEDIHLLDNESIVYKASELDENWQPVQIRMCDIIDDSMKPCIQLLRRLEPYIYFHYHSYTTELHLNNNENENENNENVNEMYERHPNESIRQQVLSDYESDSGEVTLLHIQHRLDELRFLKAISIVNFSHQENGGDIKEGKRREMKLVDLRCDPIYTVMDVDKCTAESLRIRLELDLNYLHNTP